MRHNLYAILIFSWLLPFFPVAAIAQGPGQAAFRAAENLRKQGKCNDAIPKYDEAIRAEPSNYKYYFQKGKCEYSQKEFEAAKESFRNTVDYKRDFTPAYSLLAKIYKDEKDYENAIYYYGEAANNEKTESRKIHYKLLLVNLLLKEDRVYDARRHIEEAKAMDPNNPNVLYYNAEINAMDGNWEYAKQDYLRALETEKVSTAPAAEKAKYYYGLGLAFTNLGDNENAKKAWAKANFGPYKKLIAQQMQKTNHLYFYKIAISYYLSGEFRESENYIEKALELQRDFASAYMLKGRIAKKEGNLTRAVDYYEQAISMEKDAAKQAKMYAYVASLQLSNNDAYGALSSINQALANNSNSGTLLFMKARAEYDSGRFQDAVSTLERLVVMASKDARSKARYSFMLGMAANKLADTEKAKEAFQNAMYGPYKPAARIELEKLSKKG
jgi:tetratricopeptide (TPR) repeat protein